MQIVIDIPEEQVKKSLEESKHIHEDEGEKGFVDIMMHYTNGRLEFVDVSRKENFYSCEYKILPKGHGRLIDADRLKTHFVGTEQGTDLEVYLEPTIINAPTVIEAESEDKE